MKRLSLCGAPSTFLLSTALLFSLTHSATSQEVPIPLSSFATWHSVADRGNWSDPTTWNTQADGSGLFGVPGSLDQAIVQAGDTVETDDATLKVSAMTLEGVLEDDNSYRGHHWGIFTGAGTLIVRETLPHYSSLSDFFSTGTVIYGGTGNYVLPSSPIQYYNLSFRGRGIRTMSSDLTVTHDFRITEDATVTAGNYDLTLQGNWYNTTGTDGLISSGKVTFNSLNDAQIIEGVTTFHHLVVNKGPQTLTIKDDVVLTGDWLINSGTVDSGETTLTVGNDWTNHGTYQGLGTVVFNGTGTTHTVGGSSATTFGSLKVDGLGSTFLYNNSVAVLFNLTVTRGTFTHLGALPLPLDVPGDLTIGSLGVLDATQLSSLTVSGNWTNRGTFISGLHYVVFNGSTTQTLVGETRFFGLEKTNGGRLILNDGCTVNGTLSLTDGYVRTSATSVLEVGTLATITGGSDNSYVEGPLRHAAKVGTLTLLNSMKLFPFGSQGTYRPATLSVGLLGAPTTVYYQGELHEGPPPTRNLPGTVHHTSQQRYYRISQPTIVSLPLTVEASVSIAYNTDDVVDVPSELRLVKSDGSGNWVDIGGVGTDVVGTITSTVFNSFSDFVLSSSTENNPLPVELLSLTAQPQHQTVHLRWRTASETDNSHFVIERAADGKHFVPVAIVEGAGTREQEREYEAWDQQPLSGRAYYRLRQVDFDGGYEYSRPVSVNFLGVDPVRVRVYPNPAGEQATVTVRGLAAKEPVQVQLVSPGGKVLQTWHAQAPGTSPLSVDLPAASHYPPGVYTVVVRSGQFYGAEKLLIE